MSKFSSVVLRSDVDDMPELIRTERPVVMSELQRRAYIEMVAKHLVEIGDGSHVSAKDGGPRMMKLQQIVNGYLMSEGKIIDIDPEAPIYDALLEQIDGTLPGKSIVWCRFREDIRRIAKRLHKEGYKFLEYHGGVPTAQREPIRLQFQNDDEHTVLIGQPGAGGEGKDFSRADAVIFFSSTPNAIHYAQAEERATQIKGKSVAIVRMTTPGTVDDRNWEIVDGKVSLADTVSGTGLRDLLLQTDI
jgi:SNF2 family DNA or RNA helicase